MGYGTGLVFVTARKWLVVQNYSPVNLAKSVLHAVQ